MRRVTTPKLYMQTSPDSHASEIYRSLWFNLDYVAFYPGLRAITITSANAGEGKTTIAIQLAIATAQTGKKVVLIDANLRAPMLHRSFGKDNCNGLTDFLANQSQLSEILEDSGVDNLSLITSGPIPTSTSQLLVTGRIHALITDLRNSFDIIIVDTPPILAVTDARIISSACDGVLLVVEHGKLKKSAARKIQEDFTRMKSNLVGVVYNKIRKADAKAYFS